MPVLVYLVLPESPRWHLRKGQPQTAVEIVNRIIRRSGSRVPPLMVEALGDHAEAAREKLPPYWALFARGQLRWTTVGILAGVCAGTAYFLISVLLPKALVDQGAAVSLSFGLTSLVYFASIPGKAFTGFLMEVIGRRWTIAYALAGSLPGIFLMLMAHRAGQFATVVMVTGALITGFTVLSAFTATRVYLSEQFPTALRGRGHPFGESTGRLFAGVLAPFLMEPHTGSPTIFFGTILVVVAIGAFIPLAFGRETVGQLETVTETDAGRRLSAARRQTCEWRHATAAELEQEQHVNSAERGGSAVMGEVAAEPPAAEPEISSSRTAQRRRRPFSAAARSPPGSTTWEVAMAEAHPPAGPRRRPAMCSDASSTAFRSAPIT